MLVAVFSRAENIADVAWLQLRRCSLGPGGDAFVMAAWYTSVVRFFLASLSERLWRSRLRLLGG